MLIAIGSLACINILATGTAGVYLGKKFVDTQTKEKIYIEQSAQTQQMEKIILSAQEVAKSTAVMMGYTYQEVPTGQYTNIIQDNFKRTKKLFGIGYWLEPNSFDKDKKRVGKYIYRLDDLNTELITTDIYESKDYDYFKQEYYKKVKETQQMQYLGPYYDVSLDKTFLTCSVPIMIHNTDFKGCVTVDIDFKSLQSDILKYNALHNNRLYIRNENGAYIIKPTNTFEISKAAYESSAYKKAWKSILTKDSGTIYFFYQGKKYHLYFQTLPDLNWKVIYELPESELNQPVYNYLQLVLVMGSVMALFTGLFLVYFISRQVIYPLHSLEEECVEEVDSKEEQNIVEKLDLRKDEFARIGRVILLMKKRMRNYQVELENTIQELTASGDEIIKQNESLLTHKKKLEEANQYNTAIVKALPDMIFLLSKDGRFLDIQGNDKSLYLPKSEFIGRYISDIMPKGIAIEALEKIGQCMDTKQTQILEYALANETQDGYFELRIAYFVEGEAVGIVRDITKEHMRTEEIEYLSYHDQLTGIYNRRYYEKIIKSETYFQKGDIGGIIFADLNGLKLVNDSFGHEAGDEFIIKFAEVLKKSRFSDGIISRIGGDEFTVFVKNQEEKAIQEFIQEVMEECKKKRVQGVILSASFGYQMFEGKSKHMIDMINMAETQMYRTKMFEAQKRQQKTMDIIIQTLQENNPLEKDHALEVIYITNLIAQGLNMGQEEMEVLQKIAKYHDIGKIGIEKNILNNQESYNDLEYEAIQKHPEIGYRILQSVVEFKDISEYVLYHHERWDGKGYPKGLKGEEIPLYSRIVCLADAYVAMISKRKYRKNLTKEEAIEEIRQNAGRQFDPKVASILIQKLEYKK